MTTDPASNTLERSARNALGVDEIHIVVVDMDELQRAGQTPADVLSDVERARAARFHFAEHRDRYVARRGLLRALLSGYLGVPPADIEMAQGPYGKPCVVASQRSPGVAFNISHSGRLAVYAFSRGRALGIDVERVRGDIDHGALASRFFAPAERDALVGVSETALPEWFFACWTRKEAVVKAHGAGLSLPLDRFEVSVDPNAAPRLEWRSDDGSTGAWRLETFRPRPGFIASIAILGEPASIVLRGVDDLFGAAAT